MSNSNTNAVLRRKATVGREAYQARAMSPAKALRLALSKAADELFDLPLAVTGVQQSRISLGALLNELSDDTLLILLDGPDQGLGVITLDIQLLGGLIEMQTTSRVIPGVAEQRRPTRTDAAMVAPLVDAFLERFEANLAEEQDGYWVTGFRFGVRVEDLRMLGLALEEPEYNFFQLNVDLFGGAKTGEISLLLPVRAVPRLGTDSAHDGVTIGENLATTLMNVPTDINAVLRRLTMPLSAVSQLKIGDILTLPSEALHTTALEATAKKKLAEVSLGQLNGFRAVRLNGAVVGGGKTAAPEVGRGFEQEGAERAASLLDIPDLPDLPSLPEMDLPDMGAEVEGLSDLPDLPDLPSLHDLPDLPPLDLAQGEGDLPDIGAMPMIDLPPLET